MVKGTIFLVFVVLSAGVFLLEPAAEAFSCSDMSPAVMQCAPFALGAVSQPSGGCCNEVSRLVGLASTTNDRQQACNCLKALAPQYPGAVDSNLLSIPQKCGVSLHFSLSRDTDCSKDQFSVRRTNHMRTHRRRPSSRAVVSQVDVYELNVLTRKSPTAL
ncbi:hypothetical protein DH2020_022625 [Rehmannia glutinosa]|uniref:Non-specific lipid-transfer protein n=1 Tax=Rehmannia glutinosa TaxID=99300 RepID=A0ABR0W3S5_REHGL